MVGQYSPGSIVKQAIHNNYAMWRILRGVPTLTTKDMVHSLVFLLLVGITVHSAPVAQLVLQDNGPPSKLDYPPPPVLNDQNERRFDSGTDDSGSMFPSDPAEENNDDTTLFEGDMILTPEQRQFIEDATAAASGGAVVNQKRNFYTFSKRWPNNVVFYEPLDGKEDWKRAIKAGMQHVKNNTCIRFQESTTGSRLKFHVGVGCSSLVGMREKAPQKVSISYRCTRVGTVAHEILHALGFVHEQSRPDRDDYITVHWDNIKPQFKHDFVKYNTNQVDTMQVPYDVGSALHYGPTAFAIDKSKKTITTKDPSLNHLLGQRVRLSKGDIAIVNLVYKCPPKF